MTHITFVPSNAGRHPAAFTVTVASITPTEENTSMTPSWEPLWPYRAVLAVDARDFSSHTSKRMQEINADIQRVLAQALSATGLSARWERRAFPQHTGDGYVAGLDPEVLPALVGCFPQALSDVLHDYRRQHSGQSVLQLRVSVHVGPLPSSGLGVPMVETHRLLDDQALRDLLTRANPQRTNTVMIISQRVYEDVFRSGLDTGTTISEDFAQTIARAKKFSQPAWLHVPGLDWGLADRSLFEVPEQNSTSPSAHEPHRQEPQPASAPSFVQYGDRSFQGQNQYFNGGVGGQ
ncbi:hypothetical protein K2224_37685 (plasmid) [Streptomyces sp. BHT-5-2]|uniref:hypothetical protein n=1 Tax=Streptomyces sp. BHT-5-2 TaxID=2866715 RepID=UPI001C8E2A21|nr:hypothetical protein [Streptomyces sp. BHT-5-2]QZL08770.1 hypothetical protein K2224_37685 [Streptomyces sp. BHT-5-2]